MDPKTRLQVIFQGSRATRGETHGQNVQKYMTLMRQSYSALQLAARGTSSRQQTFSLNEKYEAIRDGLNALETHFSVRAPPRRDL
jgi:hypothetical protein